MAAVISSIRCYKALVLEVVFENKKRDASTQKRISLFLCFLFFSPPDWVLDVGLGVRGVRQPLNNKDSSSAVVHFPPLDVRKEFNISFPSFSSRFDRRPSHFLVGVVSAAAAAKEAFDFLFLRWLTFTL